jgi:hypothetical protein
VVIVLGVAAGFAAHPAREWWQGVRCRSESDRAASVACAPVPTGMQVPGESAPLAARAVVLSPPASWALLKQCSRPAPDSASMTGTFTPSQTEIALGDSLVRSRLRSELSSRPGSARPASEDYRLQYAGFHRGDERVIYINGFYKIALWVASDTSKWRTEAVHVCNGGIVFFGAEFDPDRRTLRSLDFNESS